MSCASTMATVFKTRGQDSCSWNGDTVSTSVWCVECLCVVSATVLSSSSKSYVHCAKCHMCPLSPMATVLCDNQWSTAAPTFCGTTTPISTTVWWAAGITASAAALCLSSASYVHCSSCRVCPLCLMSTVFCNNQRPRLLLLRAVERGRGGGGGGEGLQSPRQCCGRLM